MPAVNRGLGKVMRAGVPDVMQVAGEPELRQLACDEEGVRDLRRLGVASMVAVPLRARGRLLGFGLASYLEFSGVGSWVFNAIAYL